MVEAREAQALPSAVYSIAARKPYDQGAVISPGWSLQASRMKLELGLVHEGDFISYLRRLANPPAGIFQIDHCTIQGSKARNVRTAGRAPDPRGGGTSSAGAAANLSAICEIDWITLIEEAQPVAGAPVRAGR